MGPPFPLLNPPPNRGREEEEKEEQNLTAGRKINHNKRAREIPSRLTVGRKRRNKSTDVSAKKKQN